MSTAADEACGSAGTAKTTVGDLAAGISTGVPGISFVSGVGFKAGVAGVAGVVAFGATIDGVVPGVAGFARDAFPALPVATGTVADGFASVAAGF